MYPNQAFESESVRIDACEEGVVLSLVHSGLVARHTGVEDVFGQSFSHILDTTKRTFKRTNLPCAVVGNEEGSVLPTPAGWLRLASSEVFQRRPRPFPFLTSVLYVMSLPPLLPALSSLPQITKRGVMTILLRSHPIRRKKRFCLHL